MFFLHIVMGTMCMPGTLGGSEVGVSTPGIRILKGCEPPYLFREASFHPLQKQKVILTT